MTKLRILCLHGLFQNEIVFKRSTIALQQSVENVADLVHITAPHPIQPKSFSTVQERTREEETKLTKEKQLFGWWYPQRYKPLLDNGTCVGTRETLDYLKRVMAEKGPFDGVLGFSQGACLAACLAGLLETKATIPGVLDTPIAHPPLKMAIIVAGFFPKQQEAFKDLFEQLPHKLKTPSLHIIGTVDHIVLPEDMEKLASSFDSPAFFRHDGTHFVPTSTVAKRAFAKFVGPFSNASVEDNVQ
ncbi:hypothetical protein DM01DRAFT_1408863 [Hesseltinella vesiculosa]|uniref:Serine hydrolase domain-containing protein n=1 Tax=Hesseltinella vesiculosa TaxID=101127 RepID=A0A1X2GCR7_9FUNG|nr:hypothetical protein DM01DRAFT_1408863 [Hesseltinella vesiculosa]